MKILLVKDVYKLGRAGEVKRVADGYGRNYLIPQGLAVLATPAALKQVEYIREKAAQHRAELNEELGSVADILNKTVVLFGVRAGETGKLYGSITSQDIAEAIEQKTGFSIKRQQIDMQPLRTLGEHIVPVRMTMDLVPEVKVIIHREGEAVELETPMDKEAEAKPEAEPSTEPEAEVEEASETPETEA